jgi:ketosteroid isomerase-like protein
VIRSLLTGLCGLALVLVAAPARASDTSDAIAFIHKFVDAGNGTDREAWAALCAPDAIIVDHVPPYVFSGPKACQDNWDAEGVWVERNKIVVASYAKLDDPTFVDIAGDRVYAVFPATASLTRDGQKQTERAVWTFVLSRAGQGWRVSAVSWSTLAFTLVP